MREATHTLLPLFAFMLIPVWIPMVAMVAGRARDLVRPRREHPVVVRRRERLAAGRPSAPATQSA